MSLPSDISVIIPYHNREQYIDETIQSVLAQSLQPLEIIIVNDGSLESSRQYLNRWTETCKIIDLPTSTARPGAVRNEGVRHARGLFVAFLDDDDIWLPQKLEVQRNYMGQHPECDVLYTAFNDARSH